jgi:hypothetical protein
MIFQWLIPILINLAIGIGLTVVAYLLMPKAKQSNPEFRDLEYPTADAGRNIPVIQGTVTIKGVNVLHYTEKTTRTYKVKA